MVEDVSGTKPAPRGRSRAGIAALLGLCGLAYLALVEARVPPVLVASGTAAGAMARPKTSITRISCERLPNVPGKSITTALVTFPPDAFTPRHRHPGSVTAYVLKGTLHSQLMGAPVETYTVGQSWFEPPGTIHLFAENASATEPAELLAIFVADDDCGPLTVFDDDGQ